jgi:hypothetical protein
MKVVAIHEQFRDYFGAWNAGEKQTDQETLLATEIYSVACVSVPLSGEARRSLEWQKRCQDISSSHMVMTIVTIMMTS